MGVLAMGSHNRTQGKLVLPWTFKVTNVVYKLVDIEHLILEFALLENVTWAPIVEARRSIAFP